MAKNVGEDNFAPGVKESVKKFIPENHKIAMGRAKRGLYAGRHIQYGNQISEDGGGIDEYLLKTPSHKMDTEMGFFWKAKMEKMYKEQELGQMDVEDETKLASPDTRSTIMGIVNPTMTSGLVQGGGLQGGVMGMAGLGDGTVTVASGSPANQLSDVHGKSNGDLSLVSPVQWKSKRKKKQWDCGEGC
ncbi:hypothetical protein IFM89_024097 [Coptis chinensis]|uniref:Uncharacterized protein n=1 Tax=Coptis chinensis TaxID=261450 RepID=A0A835IEN0_9MAGN|nr:hypothetical protein IFM89_024097 [Coptis chinensis]